MKYNGKILDEFQEDAIKSILNGESVIVAAPTGTGKTLVADFCIDNCIQNNERVIYTAPIKALSNQKYKEFVESYGESNVGMITGDVVVNRDASVLVMTTEIYRNMLFSRDELSQAISWVIFDEIHYISDLSRGSVWEEAIMLKGLKTKMIGLSATIPNIDDLAQWISSVAGEKISVVKHSKRAVPLTHKAIVSGGIYDLHSLEDITVSKDSICKETDYIQIVKKYEAQGPLLYFCFKRKLCFEKAKEYASLRQVKSFSDIKAIEKVIDDIIDKYEIDRESICDLDAYLNVFFRGVGVHHAGLLPVVKMIVEELFGQKLLDVIFCTETFAIGLNFPVKTVCIDGCRKFDGVSFRNLLNKEYFQIAGRAGRRGIDVSGNVLVLFKMSDLSYKDYVIWNESKMELLKSYFNISYNTVVNILIGGDELYDLLLHHNFGIYLGESQYHRFLKAKEEFRDRLSLYRSECCKSFGKNNCRIHNKHSLECKENHLKERFITKREIDVTLREMEILNKTKTLNCDKCQKSYCQGRYEEYLQFLNNYILEKNMYEEFAYRYSKEYFESEFRKKKNVLVKMGYIDRNNDVTTKGLALKDMYIQELLLSEIICTDFLYKYGEATICGIVAGLESDVLGVKEVEFNDELSDAVVYVYGVLNEVLLEENAEGILKTQSFDERVCDIIYRVAMGESVVDITTIYDLDEGIVVGLVRRAIAVLGEMKDALKENEVLIEKIDNCVQLLDRDEYRMLY